MRIFVCEYITGGGLLNEPLPASLAREGELMARALVRDLADIHGVDLVVSRDPRLPAAATPAEVVVADARRDIWATWREIIARTDAVWPIAPETGGVLERLSARVLEHGRVLLGTRPRAVAVAASKRATARRLAAHGVAVAPTYRVAEAPLAAAERWVVKPDDGVGCSGARYYTRESLSAALMNREIAPDDAVQPYIEGTPASMSVLCRDGAAWLLSCNRQRVVVADGAFEFKGVVVNGLGDEWARFASIADRVASALPELWGYVGIDLIRAPEGARVLEINPRLTTSYAGLREALGINPAAAVLALAHEDPKLPPDLRERAPIDVDVELGRAA